MQIALSSLLPRLLASVLMLVSTTLSLTLPGQAADVPHQVEALQSAPSQNGEALNSAKSLVVLDPAVAGWEALRAQVGAGADILVLNAKQDGLEQISSHLRRNRGYRHLAIVSEGAEGTLLLGSGRVNRADLNAAAKSLANWSDSLECGASILLFGCEVGKGQEGREFVQLLAALTGAAVAANENTTGPAHLGGDTVLEVRVGSVSEGVASLTRALEGLPKVLSVYTTDPTINTPSNQSTNEDVPFVFGSTVVVSAPDSNRMEAVVQVTSGSGVVSDGDISAATLASQGNLAGITAFLSALAYVPPANWNGTVGIQVTVTSDYNNRTAGNTETRSFQITVNPVNDAPVAGGANPALTSINEDTPAASLSGGLVSSLFGANFSDSNDAVTGGSSANTFAGIAIVGSTVNAAHGAWQYSADGTSWTDIGSRSPSSTLLLPSGDRLRFLPAANWFGTPNALTVRLIDSSGGAVTRGTGPNLSGAGSTGGATAYSAATVTLGTAVLAVNDTPVTANFAVGVAKNSSTTLTLTSTDADTGTNSTTDAVVTGYRIVTIPQHGSLRDSDGVLLAAGANITIAKATDMTYAPTANYAGDDSFTFSAVDAAGALSVASTVDIEVSTFNEPPTLTVPGSQTVAEDASVAISGISMADADAGSAIVQIALSVSQGTLTLSSTADLTFHDGTANGNAALTVRGTMANLNSRLAGLLYTPTPNYFGSDKLTVTANDLGASGSPAKQDVKEINITVTGVPDKPVTGSAILAAINEDPVNPPGATLTSLLTGYSDLDNQPMGGVAIVADASNATTQGRWQYSVNNGASWNAVGSVSATSALLIPANAKLRFRPVANYFGTPGTLTLHALDNSGGRTFTTNPAIRQTINATLSADDLDPIGGTVTTTVNPVNDPMVVVTSLPLAVNEGGTATLGGHLLKITDTEASASQIVYTVVASGTDLSEGVMQFDSLGNGSFTTVVTTGTQFTQADIDANRLRYVHDGEEPEAPQILAYTVTDNVVPSGGTVLSRSLSIEVSPVNDTPQLYVPGQTPPSSALLVGSVAKAGTLTFSIANIFVIDPDNTDEQLVFRLESLPVHGELRYNGGPVSAGSVFNYKNFKLGLFEFTHDGGDDTADTFNISLRDGAGGMVASTAVNLSIGRINTAPFIDGRSTILEWDQDVTLALNIADGQTAVNDLTIRILSLPAASEAILKFNNVEITPANVAAGFDIPGSQRHLLTITHLSANRVNPPNLSFDVRVTDDGFDGGGFVAPLSSEGTIDIRVRAVDDEPTLAVGVLELPSRGATGTFTDEHIAGADVDTAASRLLYRLESRPVNGTLWLQTKPLGVGATFTQADVDSGRLTYRHRGTDTIADSFDVTLRDQGYNIRHDRFGGVYADAESTTLKPFTVGITIEPSGPISGGGGSGGQSGDGSFPTVAYDDTLETDKNVDVVVNQSVLLANDGGTTPFTIASVGNGQHGNVSLAGGVVTFTPDHNFSGEASFEYTMRGANGEEDTALVTVIVYFINYAPAIAPAATLALNEDTTATIDDSILKATDVDNEDADLVFVISSLPTNGRVVFDSTPLTDADDATDLALLDTFTQEQVNEGNIKFVHDGSEDFIAFMGLALSDGAADAVSVVLNIDVTPVNDVPTLAVRDFNQDEGAATVIDSSLLSASDLDGIDDDKDLEPDTLTYAIANAGHLPSRGQLQLDSDNNGSFETVLNAGSVFTPAQVTAGRLRYEHDGGESISDAFTVTLSDGAGGVVTATVNIGIVPVNDDPVIVANEGLTIDEGASAIITTSRLLGEDPDNSDTQIQFRITANTAHGSLYLDGMLLGVGSAITQEQLANNLLSYQHDGFESTSDSFHFTLSDGGGGNEPSGVFPITITPLNDAPIVHLPESQMAAEGVDFAVEGVFIEDPDSVALDGSVDVGFGPIQVVLTAGNGILEVTGAGGVTVLGNESASITLTGTLGAINDTLGSLIYTSGGDFHGPDTITVLANDQGNFGAGAALEDEEILVIEVLSVNDAPVIARPATQSVDEDTDLVFSAANGNAISFSDIDIGSGNAAMTIAVTNGTVTLESTTGLSGVSGNGGASLSFTGTQSAINSALDGIKYRGALNYFGSVTLTVTVNDLGNTGDIGESLSDVKTVAITVDPVNDAPVTVNQSTSVTEDAVATLTLGSTDVDSNSGGANTTTDAIVNRYRIVATSPDGVLRDSANNVVADGSLITVAAATGMTFTPTQDFNGAAIFTFRAVDAAGAESVTSTFTVNISPVNDNPVLAGAGDTVNFTEGEGPGQLGEAARLDGDGNFTMSDAELTVRLEDNFAGAFFTVQRSGGPVTTDRFSLDTTGVADGHTVTVAGSNVSVDGTVVAVVTDNSSLSGRAVVTFNEDATQAAAVAVMKRIAFNSVDDDLTGSITIAFTFNDGNAAISPGAQGTGGAGVGSATFIVNVLNVNDAPLFTGNGVYTVAEDTAAPTGASINSLMAARFFDYDNAILGAGEFAGVAITADASNQTTQGRWQYSVDGATWFDVSPLALPGDIPSSSKALLLSKATFLRFVPVADFNDHFNNATVPAGALTAVAIDSSGTRSYSAAGSPQFVDTVSGWTDTSDLGSDSPASIIANVTSVNDPSAFANLHNDTTGFIEAVGVNIAGTATLLDDPTGPGGAAVFTDMDLTVRKETTFNGATLSVQQKGGVDTYDFFVPQTGGGITLSGEFTEPGPGLKLFNNGSIIRYNGTFFATITENSAGTGRLRIAFNQAATKEAMDALLQNLVYSNNNPTITAGNKTITLTFADGNGSSNNNQGSGGALSTSADVIITITPTNDSPAFTSGVTIATIEDTPSTPATVRALLLEKFIDLDELPSDLAGIAVGGFNEAGLGTWQVNWGDGWITLNALNASAGGLSNANALMLDDETQIQFIPAANANTAGGVMRPTLTVFAVEDIMPFGSPPPTGSLPPPVFTTNAAAPVTFDTTSDDLDSYVSDNAVAVDATIAERNDAPTFASGTAFSGSLQESPVLGQGTDLEQLLTSVSVADLDLATTATLSPTNFGAGIITVSLTDGGAGDMFTVAGSPAGIASRSGGSNGADLVINLSTSASLAQVNTILQAIRYQHTTDEPPSGIRAYTVTLSDGSNRDAQNDTAGGPAQSAQLAGTIELTSANDPPQLAATALSPDFIEGSPASIFYTGASTDPTGAGQEIIEARFTLSNLKDGNHEKLTIDGAELDLVDGAHATTTGSVTITVAGGVGNIVYANASGLTAAEMNTFINALAYRNSSEAPTAGARSLVIEYLKDDGGRDDDGIDDNDDLGVTASVVTVYPRNDAPVIAGVMTNPTATENAGAGTGVDPVLLLTGGSLSDVDGAPANMGQGTITVSFASYVNGDVIDIATGVSHLVNAVQLAGSNVQISNGSTWTTIGTVNGTENGQGRSLVINLNSNAIEDHIGPVLNAVRYRSTSDNPTLNNTATTRAYSFRVNDGDNNATAGGLTSEDSNLLSGGTLTITPVNDIPVVDLNGPVAGMNNVVTWTEVANGPHIASAISSAGTLADPDNTNLTRMVMTVSGVLDGNSERLIIGGTSFPLATAAVSTDIGDFRVSYDDGAGVFTITPDGAAVALLTSYQALLNGITYNNLTDHPTAGDRVIAVNITDAGLDNNSDADNLQSIDATTTVSVVPVNDQPVISNLDAAVFFEHALNNAPATIDADVSLTDIDSSDYAGGTLTVSGLVAGQDVVSLPAGSAAVIGSVRSNGGNVQYHNGSTWITVGAFSGGGGVNFVVSMNASATAAITERIVEHLQFANSSLAPATTRTLTIATDDGDGNPVQNAAVDITIRLDNDAPVLAATSLGLTYVEQAAPAAFVSGAISVADPDMPANFYNGGSHVGSLTVSLDGYRAGDTLSVAHTGTGAGQIGVSGSNISFAGATFASMAGGNASNLVITFTANAATPAAVQALLANLRFSNVSNDDPTVNTTDPDRAFTVTLNDGGNVRDNLSATTALTGTLVGVIVITPVNDLAVITPSLAAATYIERDAALTVDSAITIADADDTEITSASVAISSHFTDLDTLAATSAGGIVVGYDSNTGILSLSGTTTLANYQTVFRSVTFSSTSEDPTVNATRLTRTLTYSVTDADSDGAGAATGTATKIVNITAINSKPVVTAGATLGYTEQDPAAVIDSTITLSDLDDTQIASARVTVSAGLTDGDTLAVVSQNGITGNYSSATGVLTLTGTATLANYQTALRSVTFYSNSDHPTAISGSRTITWDVTDANSDQVGAETSLAATSAINITPVNDAPVNSLVATISGYENTPLGFTGPNVISVADPDLNLSTTRLTASLGVLSVNLDGGASITAGENGTASLTLSGTQAQINAALATLVFSGPVNYHGDALLTVVSRDSGALVDTDVILITLESVNSAPAGTDGSFLVIMNSSYTLSAANFGFTDPNDVPANNFLRLQVASLPDSGSLTVDGLAVLEDQIIPVADIDAGKLVYTPPVDQSGTAFTSFTFQVHDDGGTDNGGVDVDPTPNTLAINVSGTEPQHICFCPPTKASRYDTVTLTASASSGLPVIFQVASGPGTIAGNVLTFTGGGAVVVKARQFGDETYAAAPDKVETIQAIDFYIPSSVADGWTVTYGGEDDLLVRRNSQGKAMAMQVVGNFAVSVAMTGSTTNEAGDTDIYTAKYDAASGEKLWAVIHGGESALNDEGAAVAMDSAGDVWIAGTVTNADKNTDLYVARYASEDGALLWEQTFRGEDGETDSGNDGVGGYPLASPYQGGDFRHKAIALTPDGGVVVTGFVTKADKKMDALTLKYAGNGSLVWKGIFDGTAGGADYGQAVAVDAAGDVFVSGASVNATIDAIILKYSGADGARRWDKTYDGGKPDAAVNIMIDANGHPVISGYSQRATFDFLTARYDSADGTLIWMDLRDGPANSSDMAWDFALADGTRPIVTGTSYPRASIFDGYTFAFNCPCSSDPVAWAQRYDGPDSRQDQFLAIGTDMFGNPVVTGYSQNANGTYDTQTVKYAAGDGSILWSKRYNGPANGNDLPSQILVDPAGNIFIAGYTTTTAGVKDSWVTRYVATEPSHVAAQVITFLQPPAQGVADSLTLNATASSGLPVEYEVISGPAYMEDNVVGFMGFGAVTIRATQPGDGTYLPAVPVERTFMVGKSRQVIVFTLPATVPATEVITLSGLASSGLPVAYELISGPGVIEGGVLSFTGAGAVTVRASQEGGAGHSPAASVVRTVTAEHSSQSLSFTLPVSALADQSIVLNGTASSGAAPHYAVVSGPGVVSDGVLSFTGAGTVVVSACQPGGEFYSASPSIQRSIKVSKASQSIVFTLPAAASQVGGEMALSGEASSGLAVEYTVVGPAVINGGTLSFTGAGKVTVQATQPGSEIYNAARAVSRVVTVAKLSQSIAFTLPPTSTILEAHTLAATSSSGLPVSYTVGGPGVITPEGKLTFTGAGKVTVRASQAGDAVYAAAPAVSAVTTVALVKPILQPLSLSDLMVGEVVTGAVRATRNPAKFVATGLPPGVALNAKTGALSGRPTACKMVEGEVAPYQVTFTASNAAGSSEPITVTWKVLPLPGEVVGCFNGLVEATEQLSVTPTQTFTGLGGYLSVTTNTAGSFTGKIIVDTLGYAFSGKLNVTQGSNPTGTALIKRKNCPTLSVSFSIDRENGELAGTVTDSLIEEPLGFLARRNPWHATSNPATVLQGAYTAALELPEELFGQAQYPQGNGYGTLKVNTAGVAIWSGKLADGTPGTASTTIDREGRIALHISLYTPKVVATAGAVNGWLRVDTEAALAGSVRWKKNPQAESSTTRSYREGIPGHDLAVLGGKYLGTPIVAPPAEGPSTAHNAVITFSEGGLETASYTQASNGQLRQTFRLTNGKTVTMPTGLQANPGTVKLAINATTGLFTGSFVLKDADPTDTVAPIAVITRTVTYTGAMVPQLNQGIGHFVLPQLPSLNAGAPTTITTSPQLSGQVLLDVLR